MKDNLSQLQEERKIIDELNWLRKKVEQLSSNLQNQKKDDESLSMSNKMIPVDTSKFLEITVFNDYKLSVNKEMENIDNGINELRRYIEDILIQLKSKAADKDLKNLEDYLLVKIEELKSACNKKYADKNETAKNLKYLDQQIKHIIDMYTKKMEKGDNWLLAKKPLGGNSCASCEAYIGDLHDNAQYVPWNKYPLRDPNDKLYRIGNGFSKMLQMINVDNPMGNTGSSSKPKPIQTTSEFYKPNQDTKKEIQLPKVKSNINMNMSADDIDMDGFEAFEDPLQPKM